MRLSDQEGKRHPELVRSPRILDSVSIIPSGVLKRKAKNRSVGGARESRATSSFASPPRTPGGHQVRSAELLGQDPSVTIDDESLSEPTLCSPISESVASQAPLICIALAALGCEFAWGVILWVREVQAQEWRTVRAGFFTSAW